jgi:hypothetical protein
MNRFLLFVTVCVVLALVKAAIIALGIALLLAVLVALIKHPRDTLLSLLTVMLIGLANARPMAFIVTLGIVCVAAVVAGASQKSRRTQLLLGRDAGSVG